MVKGEDGHSGGQSHSHVTSGRLTVPAEHRKDTGYKSLCRDPGTIRGPNTTGILVSSLCERSVVRNRRLEALGLVVLGPGSFVFVHDKNGNHWFSTFQSHEIQNPT